MQLSNYLVSFLTIMRPHSDIFLKVFFQTVKAGAYWMDKGYGVMGWGLPSRCMWQNVCAQPTKVIHRENHRYNGKQKRAVNTAVATNSGP